MSQIFNHFHQVCYASAQYSYQATNRDTNPDFVYRDLFDVSVTKPSAIHPITWQLTILPEVQMKDYTTVTRPVDVQESQLQFNPGFAVIQVVKLLSNLNLDNNDEVLVSKKYEFEFQDKCSSKTYIENEIVTWEVSSRFATGHSILPGYASGDKNILSNYFFKFKEDYSIYLPMTTYNYIEDPSNFPCAAPVISNVQFYSLNNLV